MMPLMVFTCAPNALYTEINWFYPKSGSEQIDRCVTYNYSENVFTTSSLARTTYSRCKGVFQHPYATEYNTTDNSCMFYYYQVLQINLEHLFITAMKKVMIKSTVLAQLLLMLLLNPETGILHQEQAL